MLNKYFFLFILIVSSSFAKNYKVNLIVDNESQTLIKQIKTEINSLFQASDDFKYNIQICEKNCDNYLNKKENIILFKSLNEVTNTNSSSIITYNFIESKYDEDKVVRATALAIYELIKENKYNFIHLNNKKKLYKIEKANSKLKTLNLKDIYTLTINNNLEIKQNLNDITLTDLNIDEAKTDYKPQISLYSNYTKIDADRAKYSNGLYSEDTFDSGLKVSQLIFSNQVLKNIEIKKLLSKSSRNEIKALNDEIMYKATLIYLNILKIEKATEIIRIKHDFISKNLQFAKDRVEIGTKNRSDIYRWESELANVNIDLESSNKELKLLKIELSNLLQIDYDFNLKEYDLTSLLFKLNGIDTIKVIRDKKVQANFINNIIFTHSRLEQIYQLTNVKKEELQMNKESRYMPTIAFEGSARKILDRSGDGKDFARPWDNEEYQAIININIPLYEGGLKSNKIQKNMIELNNLKLKYNNMKNMIMENVKKNFESLNSSYEKIKYSTIAQESSKKNFELIEDRYRNGKESIITLLDAQDTYIISELNLNISKTNYLLDICSIYFSTGQIDILVNEEKKKQVENNILKTIQGEIK